jgi:hypothetical protein
MKNNEKKANLWAFFASGSDSNVATAVGVVAIKRKYPLLRGGLVIVVVG